MSGFERKTELIPLYQEEQQYSMYGITRAEQRVLRQNKSSMWLCRYRNETLPMHSFITCTEPFMWESKNIPRYLTVCTHSTSLNECLCQLKTNSYLQCRNQLEDQGLLSMWSWRICQPFLIQKQGGQIAVVAAEDAQLHLEASAEECPKPHYSHFDLPLLCHAVKRSRRMGALLRMIEVWGWQTWRQEN